jgi:hypothetical protein
MTSLILKRGKLTRSSGQWPDEDYDVIADGKVVGRIYEDATTESYAATFEAGSVGSVTGTWRELVLAASLATRAITSSRSKKISASMASSLVVPLQL